MLGTLYDDKELVAKLPYLPVLKTSIENAVPRPVTPFYPAVTKAIQENAYSAIKGEKTVDAALSDMQKSIESASAGSVGLAMATELGPTPVKAPASGGTPVHHGTQGRG